MQLIECVPNFSEGRNPEIIKQITDEIEKVDGVKLLDVDPGKATNRTVVTFVGEPEKVIEAAFLAIRKAGELIDMQNHKGEHPRMGATDVCPIIPIRNISMDECVVWAKKLAERVGNELHIPVYLYEYAAQKEDRKNLANVRSGEYEGFSKKIESSEWKPDFGPSVFDTKRGCTAIGARDFLIAYNVNLNTTSTRRANSVAFDLRENGRVKTENGKKVLDQNGEPLRQPGLLKKVKAIGWYIEEYGITQISMNLTDIQTTPLHIAFDTAVERANARGMRVTGSELVGLIPLKCMLDAGKYFLQKQERSIGIPEREIIKIAIKSMGLDELAPFDPDKKIIEYILESNEKKLIDLSLRSFSEETAAESPAPGGGSTSAYVGALGASLGTMVANLSAHKRGWDHRWKEFSDWAVKGQTIKDELLGLVDEDTKAFDRILEALRLPKNTDEEKRLRKEAVEKATIYAIEIPLRTAQKSFDVFELVLQMVQEGNPNSISDAGVGALCARAAVRGACMNVKINAKDITDEKQKEEYFVAADTLIRQADEMERKIISLVEESFA